MKYRLVCEVLTQHQGRWLTAREIFDEVECLRSPSGFSSPVSIGMYLRRFNLLIRRKGLTRGTGGLEREYYCEKPRINPK